MKQWQWITLVIAVLLCAAPSQAQVDSGRTQVSSAAAQQLLIIVSQQSHLQQLSASELRDVYFGVLPKREDLRQLQPIDAEPGEARDFFYQYLVGRSRNQMQAYWSRARFTGRGEPPASMTLDAALAHLRTHPNSIVYVPVAQRDALPSKDVRQVLVIP